MTFWDTTRANIHVVSFCGFSLDS